MVPRSKMGIQGEARRRSNTGTILGSGVFPADESTNHDPRKTTANPPSRDRRSETTPPMGFAVNGPSGSGRSASNPGGASDSSRVGMIVDATSESGARLRQPWVREVLQSEETSSLALAPGKMIPGTRYRVQRWLGDGSMGVVYAAEHVDIGRKVAVKVLRGEGGPTPAVQAFRQEARLASQVGSEHIVQVLDFAELPGGRLMFVMEYVDGRPLNRELRKGKLSIARTIGILRQVAKGLAQAHDTKVVHRDVKPDNIMIEAHPRPDRARLLDFGVASISKTVERRAGDLVGTPFYVAPEILEGERYNELVDLYSLGCTAYEMLSGRPPFTYDSVEALLKAHVLERPVPLHEVERSVPVALSDVIMRCLSKRPQQRYPNMAQFEAALIEAQIECGEVTAWDDLPLPDVDPERRVKLMEGLNPPETKSSRWPLAIVAATALATLGAAWILTQPTEQVAADVATISQVQHIEELTATIRGAAKRHNYVYPSPDNPNAPTSYTALLELESVSHELAAERSHELRVEIAKELRTLADAYWQQNEASKIAVEFYAQVVLFDPNDELANSRALLSSEDLKALARDAADLSFEMDELIAFEPLLVVAERNRVLRRQKWEKHLRRKREAKVETELSSELDALAGQAYALDPSQRLDGSDQAIEAEAAPEEAQTEEAETAEESVDQAPAKSAAQAEEEAAKAKQAVTKTAIKAGRSALASGDLSAAEQHFKAALKASPRSAAAHDGLGRTYFNQSNFDRAVKHGRKATNLAPGNGRYQLNLGDAYYKRGDIEDALEAYEAAAASGRPEANKRVAKAKARLGG